MGIRARRMGRRVVHMRSAACLLFYAMFVHMFIHTVATHEPWVVHEEEFLNEDTCLRCTTQIERDEPITEGCIMKIHIDCLYGFSPALLRVEGHGEQVCGTAAALVEGTGPWPEGASSVSMNTLIFSHIMTNCKHPYEYSTEEVAQFITILFPGINATTTVAQGQPGLSLPLGQLFINAWVDGKALAGMTGSDLMAIGMPAGLAVNFQNEKEEFLSAQLPINVGETTGPFMMQALVLVKSLWDINEVDFSFSVQLGIMFVWTDNSLWTECNGRDEEINMGSCKYVWRPSVTYMNAREQMVISEQLIADPTTKTVQYIVDVTATVDAPMSFRNFPNDKQNLVLRIGQTLSFNRKDVMFGPTNAILTRVTDITGKDQLSGWELRSVSSKETPYQFNFEAATNRQGPLHEYMEFYEDQAKDAGIDAGDNLMYSTVEVVLEVQRVKAFYVANYVVLIVVLTALSWTVFIVQPSDLADRCQIALALVLALNVYQLILNDTMPKTPYLTPMHEYIIGSTFFIVSTCLESVLVAVCQKRAAVREAALEKFQRLGVRRSEDGVKASPWSIAHERAKSPGDKEGGANVVEAFTAPPLSRDGEDAEKGTWPWGARAGAGAGAVVEHAPLSSAPGPGGARGEDHHFNLHNLGDIVEGEVDNMQIGVEHLIACYGDRFCLVVYPVAYAVFTSIKIGMA